MHMTSTEDRCWKWPSSRLGSTILIAAFAYVAFALWAMLRAPTVPYADGWRFLGHFLDRSFIAGVLTPDNGHYEVIPNLVRIIELRFFSANQQLQIAVGAIFLVATIAVGFTCLNDLHSPNREAAKLALSIGLCWLGNIRTLGHGNETVHAYTVTLCLVLGSMAMLRGKEDGPSLFDGATSATLGLIASFCFGSGFACFVAFFLLAALRRARFSVWCVLFVMAVVTIALRQIGNTDSAAIQIHPALMVGRVLSWLSAPGIYAGWPLLDVKIAAQLPTAAVRSTAFLTSSAWEHAFGQVMRASWPHMLVGATGILGLLCSTWKARLSPKKSAAFGLSIAWFALAVGCMIVVARSEYLISFPEQLLAPRYVVWSSLFWAGLAISVLSQKSARSLAPIVALGVSVVLFPSQFWMLKLEDRMRDTAERTAVAAIVGVIGPRQQTGETVIAELASALPAIRAAHTAVFAWPESQLIGRPVPTASHEVPVHSIQVEPIPNTLTLSAGRQVQFWTTTDVAARYLILADRDGVVRGLALRDGNTASKWIGWMTEFDDVITPQSVEIRQSDQR